LNKIQAPKGTKDCLPGQIHRWQFVEEKFRDIACAFGFSEIRTPLIEHTELFERGIGDTTDVVEKQMYTFEDYGGRSITLRPEGTAGVVRAYLENRLMTDGAPGKFWYEIACFRYEKPQSGRLREFHQFGIEVIGSNDMLADAEVIAFGDAFFKTIGLTGLSLKVNSIGCPECRPIYRKHLMEYFKGHYEELCDTCKTRYERNPMRIFDCKSPICQKITDGAPVMLDSLCGGCEADFESLKENLTALGTVFEIDARIVRGLDYYTKTAFEFVSDRIGAQGTVCGGGRYDHLAKELGGDDVPGVGFGLGIERTLLAMEAIGAEMPMHKGPDTILIYIGEQAKARALSLLGELREKGISAEMDVCARNVKGQFKYADKMGARTAVIIGDDELVSGIAKMKDMRTGEESECPFEGVARVLMETKRVYDL